MSQPKERPKYGILTRLLIGDPAVIETVRELVPKVSEPFRDFLLLKAVANLTISLKPHLSSYDLILGDDAAGRLPALIFHELASRKRLQEGLPKPSLGFIHPIIDITSRYAGFDKSLDLHRTAWRHVLFVTEYIQSGTRATMIGNIVSDYDMALDVATICSKYTPASYTSIKGQLFTGEVGLIGKEGLHDHKLRDSFQGAVTEEETITAHGVPSTPETMAARTQARQDVATIADGLWPLVA